MRKFTILLLAFIFILSTFPFSRNKAQAASNIVNPNQVYSYTDMVNDLKDLQKAYPDLMKVKVIGKSEYGRNIYAFSLGKGPATVFINGSHHAREWLTTNLNMYMAEKYAVAYTKKQKIQGYDARSILDTTTIWFVPMVNPDGVVLQQTGLTYFPKKDHAALIKMNGGSKNFTRWKANGKGVDLNRQYNAGWTAINGPTKPSFKNYKGKAPVTAAETKAIIKFVEEIKPEMAVSYHSSGEILYWNYKQNSADYKRDHVYAKKIGSMTGYSLVYPGKNPSGGGFTDWFIQSKKRPGFTPEISRYYVETSPPVSEFPRAWQKNQAVGFYVAQEGGKLYDAKQAKVAAGLESQLKTLDQNTYKLKNYYNTKIKSTNDLKVEKSFVNLYNKVKRDKAGLEKDVAKLPAKYEKRLIKYLDYVKYGLTQSDNYMNGVKAGDKLLAADKAFNVKLSAGTINVKDYDSLVKLMTNTEKTIAKMNSSNVRKIATAKYIAPAKLTIENNKYEIQRYKLTLDMETQVKERKTDTVKQGLEKLEQYEKESKKLKASNSKYKSYTKVEQLLLSKKNWIAEQLDKLTASEPAQQPETGPGSEANPQNETGDQTDSQSGTTVNSGTSKQPGTNEETPDTSTATEDSDTAVQSGSLEGSGTNTEEILESGTK